MLYVSIDLETCGLDADNHDIIEFGAVLDDLSKLDPIEDLPTFHCYFVKDKYTGSPFALSMHPEIFRRIDERDTKKYNFFPHMKFGHAFKRFLLNHGYEKERDRVTINVAGKNFGSCDLQFLNKQTDLAKHVKISHKIFDPGILFVEKGDESLPGLGECKARIGLDNSVDHTAVADAIDVIHLIRFAFKDMFVVEDNNGHEPHIIGDSQHGHGVRICAKCGLSEGVWSDKECTN